MLKNLNRLAPKIPKVGRILGKRLPVQKTTKNLASPETRYRAALEQAFVQAPYYRALAANLDELAALQARLTPEIWQSEYERLFPFGAPLKNQSERYFPALRLAELAEALELTSSYNPAWPLFEISEQWEKPTQLPVQGANAKTGRRYVLPVPQAAQKFRPNPYEPDNFKRLWQQPGEHTSFALLGDAEQLEWALGEGLDMLTCRNLRQIFVRLYPASDLQTLNKLQKLVQSKTGLEKLDYLLFEPALGYFGAFSGKCGNFHVNTERVWVNLEETATEKTGKPARLLFSKLAQSRPFVLHYCPTVSNFSNVGNCALHTLHNETVLQQNLTATEDMLGKKTQFNSLSSLAQS